MNHRNAAGLTRNARAAVIASHLSSIPDIQTGAHRLQGMSTLSAVAQASIGEYYASTLPRRSTATDESTDIQRSSAQAPNGTQSQCVVRGADPAVELNTQSTYFPNINLDQDVDVPPERQPTPNLRDGENGSVMCAHDINEGNTVERECNRTTVFPVNEIGYRNQTRAVRGRIDKSEKVLALCISLGLITPLLSLRIMPERKRKRTVQPHFRRIGILHSLKALRNTPWRRIITCGTKFDF